MNSTKPISNKLNAVIFDWAGTIVDFGSCAPMGAFVKLFANFGIELTVEQARGPMGVAKRDHISALLSIPAVNQQWQQRYGSEPDETDIDRLYDAFIPLNTDVVADFADFIPGAVDIVNLLRKRGIKIGSTTGYNRAIMAVLSPIAAKGGYAPDNLVCAGDLSAGRPSPLMMYQTFADLGVWYPHTVVKVDDTGVGIQEGLNAGTWTVGVAISGNETGLTLEQWQKLDESQQNALRQAATTRLKAAGAHYVIDTVADLMPVLSEIEKQIAVGKKP